MFSTFVTSYHLLVEKLFSPHFYEFPVCILNTQNVSSCFYKYDAIVGVFYLMVAFAIYSLVWSIIGNNCSKVDQIWSVTPFVYSWVFYVHYHQGKSLFETSHPRLLLLSALMTMWGVRLTYNFWRRGGYGNLITHEEDYRWPIVRRIINNSFLFLIFNITFIAGYQNLLLFLIAMPAYAVMADKQVQIGTQDIILTAVFLLLLAMETIADQQHFNFHTRKHAVKETKSVAAKSADIDIKEGFLQSGLFKYSRHPNYFAEQALWVVVYLFSVPMTSTTTLDTSLTVYAFGSILLVLLFQGSMSLGESITLSKYPAYADYQRRTSQCVPFLPGSRAPVSAIAVTSTHAVPVKTLISATKVDKVVASRQPSPAPRSAHAKKSQPRKSESPVATRRVASRRSTVSRNDTTPSVTKTLRSSSTRRKTIGV